MTGEILLLVVLLAAAVVIFATEWIVPELTAALLLLASVRFDGLWSSLAGLYLASRIVETPGRLGPRWWPDCSPPRSSSRSTSGLRSRRAPVAAPRRHAQTAVPVVGVVRRTVQAIVLTVGALVLLAASASPSRRCSPPWALAASRWRSVCRTRSPACSRGSSVA